MDLSRTGNYFELRSCVTTVTNFIWCIKIICRFIFKIIKTDILCHSFSHLDRPFVKSEVLQYLEDEFGLNLCVHERDFLAGAAITANIAAAIQHSRRMVMVISR